MAKKVKGWLPEEGSRAWTPLEPEQAVIPIGYAFIEARINNHKKQILIMVMPKDHLQQCPICKRDKLSNNGHTYPRYKAAPQGDFKVTIIVRRQKYQCRHDKRHCPGDPLPGIDPNHNCFLNTIAYVRAHPERSDGDNARTTGYSDKTIAKIRYEHANEIDARQKEHGLFWGLCFDEIYFPGDEIPHFAVSNLLTGEYITMLEDNTADTIRVELAAYKHRDVTQLVVLDTNQEYGPLLAEAYVNARQIRDLYHLIKLAHKCRDAVRINIWRDATGEARRILYDKRHFWSRLEDPDLFRSESIFLFDNPLPKLFKANDLFKSFVGIFAVAKDTEDAQQLFELWTVKANDMLEYFGTFIETVRKHYDEIFAYPEEAATNGIAEAQNRSIRATINQGRRFGWRGAANRMACKMEVERQRSAEYLLDIANSDPHINIEEDNFNGLSKTALKRLQRAIRLQTSDVTEVPAGDSAAELSADASLLRSKRMAEIAGKRKPRIARKSKDSGDD